jgi:hypothetical protein
MTDSKPVADQFDGLIGPGQLLALVDQAAPWLKIPLTPAPWVPLAAQAASPDGWLKILRAAPGMMGREPTTVEDRDDYLALCLACHGATVATYVPTDVDAKIRGVLWARGDQSVVRRRWSLVQAAMRWDVQAVSRRVVTTAHGPVSGHDGEWLSVQAGALGAALRTGDAGLADEIGASIAAELDREVAAFRAALSDYRQDGWDLIRLAWILTHNVGDLDQGISFWPEQAEAYVPWRARFQRLGHENAAAWGNAFLKAKAIYQVVAAEGHRHYPLRQVRCLRKAEELLLPLGPCFEAWGATVAQSKALSLDEKAEVLAGLLSGIAKVPGQIGYQRAVHGLAEATSGGIDALARRLPKGAQAGLKEAGLRQHLGLAPGSFLSSLAKRAREAAKAV